MYRYKVLWSIPNAGPSVTTLFLGSTGGDNITNATAAIRAFFASRAALFPNEVSISFDTQIDELNVATGELEGSQPVAALAGVAGSGAGVWAAGSGIRVDWLTGGFVAGRRVRGRTFLVPSVGGAFGTDGRVLPAQITATQTDANTMRAALLAANMPLSVWARPSETVVRPGTLWPVSGQAVSAIAATLRGRKY